MSPSLKINMINSYCDYHNPHTSLHALLQLAIIKTDAPELPKLTVKKGSQRMQSTDISPNQLYFGDNLDILREHIDAESVDLIYW